MLQSTMKFPSFKQTTTEVVTTFKRFPLAVISALITMMLIVYLIEVDGPKYEHFNTLIKIAFASSLGIFMFTALRLLGDKNPFCLVGIAVIVGYYFMLPDMEDPSSVMFERHLFLNLMFFIMIFWVPYWKSNPSNELFWEWTQRVVFGFIVSILFSIVLYAGLSGALFSIDKLFSLEISDKRYAQLVFLVIGLFGVNYFLSQIPKNIDDLSMHTYTKVEMIFTKYILSPLAISYFLILYIYTFKILINGDFPKGILAWIIIAFSIVAIITYLFWTPLWSEKAKKYKRFLFIALFLQTIMLGVAISMRVIDYAWTENRYMVALLGVWLFGNSLYFLLFKDAKYKWLFVSLTLFIMISQIGPFSAYATGASSQKQRLTTILKSNQPLSNKSDIQIRYEVSDIINYLNRRYGIDSLKSVIPKIVAKFEKEVKQKKYSGFNNRFKYYDFPPYATKELGFEFVNIWELQAAKRGDAIPFSIFRPRMMALDVSKYDWEVEVGYFKRHDKVIRTPFDINKIPQINTNFTLTDKSLEIKENNTTIADINLTDFLKGILSDKEFHNPMPIRGEDFDLKKFEKLDFKYKDENISIGIYFFDIFVEPNGTIEQMHAKVLYKRLF